MKEDKITFICTLVASICFYISAIIDLVNNDKNWVVGLCLGTAFLCSSSANWNENKSKDKDKKKEK